MLDVRKGHRGNMTTRDQLIKIIDTDLNWERRAQAYAALTYWTLLQPYWTHVVRDHDAKKACHYKDVQRQAGMLFSDGDHGGQPSMYPMSILARLTTLFTVLEIDLRD
jgi:hypothetical protein